MPGVPCDWLSETAIVLNSSGTPPAAVTASGTSAASSRWVRLHGIVPVHVEAMPTTGPSSRSGSMPIARKWARAGERPAPCARPARARSREVPSSPAIEPDDSARECGGMPDGLLGAIADTLMPGVVIERRRGARGGAGAGRPRRRGAPAGERLRGLGPRRARGAGRRPARRAGTPARRPWGACFRWRRGPTTATRGRGRARLPAHAPRDDVAARAGHRRPRAIGLDALAEEYDVIVDRRGRRRRDGRVRARRGGPAGPARRARRVAAARGPAARPAAQRARVHRARAPARPAVAGNPRFVGDEAVLPTEQAWNNNAVAVGGGTRVFGAMAWRFCPEDFRMGSTYGAPFVDWPIGYDDLAPSTSGWSGRWADAAPDARARTTAPVAAATRCRRCRRTRPSPSSPAAPRRSGWPPPRCRC